MQNILGQTNLDKFKLTNSTDKFRLGTYVTTLAGPEYKHNS